MNRVLNEKDYQRHIITMLLNNDEVKRSVLGMNLPA